MGSLMEQLDQGLCGEEIGTRYTSGIRYTIPSWVVKFCRLVLLFIENDEDRTSSLQKGTMMACVGVVS